MRGFRQTCRLAFKVGCPKEPCPLVCQPWIQQLALLQEVHKLIHTEPGVLACNSARKQTGIG
eukprot:4392204-Amphidinium_carterae.1